VTVTTELLPGRRAYSTRTPVHELVSSGEDGSNAPRAGPMRSGLGRRNQPARRGATCACRPMRP